MKIAIHFSKNSFSERWVTYCQEKKISYKLVDCYKSNIIDDLNDCDALMWHHHHGNYKDNLIAKGLLFAVEQAGKIVFPDFRTNWHFDDKVSQKYLLESISAPIVPSFTFFNKQSAINWAYKVKYPQVFKLRKGAGASNVSLVNNFQECKKIINKAFNQGFPQFNKWRYLQERYNNFREGKEDFSSIMKGLARVFITPEFNKIHGKETGYVYFQTFIPNNQHDTRVIIIGDKAFGIKRKVRKNDFRASGSGDIIYDANEINLKCIQVAFEVNEKIKSQCIAYDFIFDQHGCPLIVEISYGFGVDAYDHCPGYWDKHLNWYKGKFNPQAWMIEDVIKRINGKNLSSSVCN